MALLHIYDSSDEGIRSTAGTRGVAHRIGVGDAASLQAALDGLVSAPEAYDRILFETHGSPGEIWFGDDAVDETWLRAAIPRHYTQITTYNARVYFNGCNVAEGPAGWGFLEAAAALFLTPGGGEVFAQTSLGFANPFNGHVIHLWGSTRRIFVDRNGRILEHFEQ